MIVSFKHITCNGITLATTTFVPETIYEKLMGLRGQDVVRGVGMIFEASNSIVDAFDTFMCQRIGWIALNKDKIVIKCGVMKPNKIKFIQCAYWLEVHPDLITSIKIGDKVQGID